jgi:ribosomal protein S18 acetylase RimI-like enzyme
MLEIKPASINDAKVLAELGATTFYETFRPHNSEEDMQLYIAKAYNEELINENLQNNLIHYALIFNNNEAIGYIKLLLDATREDLEGKNIELEKIYVLQKSLGSGAGKLLMDYAIDFSKKHQYKMLFLGVWEENERAVNFYRKAGFKVFANRVFKLGTTLCNDFIMKLDLVQND